MLKRRPFDPRAWTLKSDNTAARQDNYERQIRRIVDAHERDRTLMQMGEFEIRKLQERAVDNWKQRRELIRTRKGWTR